MPRRLATPRHVVCACTVFLLLCTSLIPALPIAPREPRADTSVRRIAVMPAETLAVHLRDSGNAPVVIVPGLLGSAFGFRHVIAELHEYEVRPYVIDLLGFGSSTRPDKADYSFSAQAARLQAVIDTLQIRDFVLVCHALSAAACYRIAHADDRVRALVSINGAPAESPRTKGVTAALRLAPLIKLFGAERIVRGKVRSGLMKSSVDPSWVTDQVLAGYLAPFKGDVFSVLTMLRRMQQSREATSLAELLPQLNVPVELLVSRAGDGSALTPDDLEELAAIPTLTVLDVHGAGQYVQEEQPAAVTAAVVRALSVQPPPRGLQSPRD